jgi:hypothetical protein
MKAKSLVIWSFFLTLSFSSFAQLGTNAIGIRFGGGGFGSSAEISYLHVLRGNNRLEFDLGGYARSQFGGFGIAGIYHWNFNLADDLHWYVGPGAAISFLNDRLLNDTYLAISVGGQIGLEYDFRSLDIPLSASLDIRPMGSFIGGGSGHGWSSALAIRYLF